MVTSAGRSIRRSVADTDYRFHDIERAGPAAAGRLFVGGRLGDMIVSGGENVYPAPVAAVITSHPEVTGVLPEPVDGAEFGRRLRATVEIRPGSVITPERLRAWPSPRLSPAERPRDIALAADLPRTATGKPLRPTVG